MSSVLAGFWKVVTGNGMETWKKDARAIPQIPVPRCCGPLACGFASSTCEAEPRPLSPPHPPEPPLLLCMEPLLRAQAL